MKTDLQNKKTEKVRLDRTGATYSSSISAKKIIGFNVIKK